MTDKIITLKKQIKALREAIEKDEAEKIKAEEHATRFRSLQMLESRIKNRISKLEDSLRGVQSKIVEQLNITFDVSDDMSIDAAKETLAKLESNLKTEKRGDLEELSKDEFLGR